MRRELLEELGLAPRSLRRLSAANRFVYSHDYKRKRALDHAGQAAVMFACEVASGSSLTLQAEEVADAQWFVRREVVAAFPVPKQRLIFEACLAEIEADRALSWGRARGNAARGA